MLTDVLQKWPQQLHRLGRGSADKADGGLSSKGIAALPLALALLGMLLILLSSLFPKETKSIAAASDEPFQASRYEQAMEARLEALLSTLSGAGRVKVMLTLASGQESVYAVDTQAADSQLRRTHILLQNGTALTETVCAPQVRGVAVICEGGSDAATAARITALLASLLDLSYSDICVQQGSP